MFVILTLSIESYLEFIYLFKDEVQYDFHCVLKYDLGMNIRNKAHIYLPRIIVPNKRKVRAWVWLYKFPNVHTTGKIYNYYNDLHNLLLSRLLVITDPW